MTSKSLFPFVLFACLMSLIVCFFSHSSYRFIISSSISVDYQHCNQINNILRPALVLTPKCSYLTYLTAKIAIKKQLKITMKMWDYSTLSARGLLTHIS